MQDLQIHSDGRMTWTLPLRQSDNDSLSGSAEWREATDRIGLILRDSAIRRWVDTPGPSSLLDRLLEQA